MNFPLRFSAFLLLGPYFLLLLQLELFLQTDAFYSQLALSQQCLLRNGSEQPRLAWEFTLQLLGVLRLLALSLL